VTDELPIDCLAGCAVQSTSLYSFCFARHAGTLAWGPPDPEGGMMRCVCLAGALSCSWAGDSGLSESQSGKGTKGSFGIRAPDLVR
jgi:hypothetical protein